MLPMNTIIGIALGLTPVHADGSVRPVDADQAQLIGRFSESVDDTGTTHLMGVDRQTGAPFHITVSPHGRVEGSVGQSVVTFQVETRN